MARVWQFFNSQQESTLYNEQTNEVILANQNESLFSITAKLDKCLMLIVKCGFSINNYLQEPENNSYVETIGILIRKLKLFVTCTELASKLPTSDHKQKFL